MELIEFLQTTEQKCIKSYIGVKVKEKLQEYETALQNRQQMLRNILEFENLQYNEEIVHLLNKQLEEQFARRMDWLNTTSMNREKAEDELLNLKQQQRELQNSEEWRHFQSKQLLLASKKGQLYQIEHKKSRIQREKDIDKMWHKVMERLSFERECQEIYRTKLLKVIERANQLKNQEINDNRKIQQELTEQKAKERSQEENRKALIMEEKYRKDEKRKNLLKKESYNNVLKTKMNSNSENKLLETQLSVEEARLQKYMEDQKLSVELEQTEREKIRNKEWHKYYLENTLREKQRKLKEANEFERMYINTGCVLGQEPKTPYGKSTR